MKERLKGMKNVICSIPKLQTRNMRCYTLKKRNTSHYIKIQA